MMCNESIKLILKDEQYQVVHSAMGDQSFYGSITLIRWKDKWYCYNHIDSDRMNYVFSCVPEQEIANLES